jgi:hypothetical protein
MVVIVIFDGCFQCADQQVAADGGTAGANSGGATHLVGRKNLSCSSAVNVV